MQSGNAVYITRSASCLPNAPVENDAVEAILGQVGPRPSRARRVVQRSNGIRRRYYAIDPTTGRPTHSNASLTAQAVRGLLGDGFALEDLALLACGTSNPDQLMPNHAVMVHGELGASLCEAVATAGVCISGVTALKYAWMSVLTGAARNVRVSSSSTSLPRKPRSRGINSGVAGAREPHQSVEAVLLRSALPGLALAGDAASARQLLKQTRASFAAFGQVPDPDDAAELERLRGRVSTSPGV